ncbi:MAG: glycosyltransferase family 2 protein [Bacteroidia bacterium]
MKLSMIVIELIVFSYFLYVVVYTLVFSVAGVFLSRKTIQPSAGPDLPRVAVLIPAYREDAVIVSSATRALHQRYPHENYEVIVIADSLQSATLTQLHQLPVKVVEVTFSQSTKVKALQAAIRSLSRNYDLVVILDADNVMENDFLSKIAAAFLSGHLALQGRRTAKNSNTQLAVLDGLSEILNNHIYRAGSTVLGLSASLSGSGMAVAYSPFAEIIGEMEATGGFDRDMEVRLGKRGIKVRYIPDAMVYDEKVSRQEAFANQRRRWIASQYQYLAKNFGTGMRALFMGDFSLFNSAVLRNIQLPRVLNIGLLGVVSIVVTLLQGWLYLPVSVWWAMAGGLALALMLAVPFSFYNRKFFLALASLPRTFLTMFFLLFKLKGANRQFIHTPHEETETPNTPRG